MIKKTLITMSVTFILTSCSSFYTGLKDTTRLCLTPKGVYHKCGNSQSTNINSKKRRKIYAQNTSPTAGNKNNETPIMHHKKIEEYIEQMVIEMQMTLSSISIKKPIAVASFVELDTDLNATNQLGLELSEGFIAELMKASFPLVEHRITGEILMTQDGDFALSRNINQVKSAQRIGYVLSGTMTQRYNGIQVNARIVGLKSNRILASSSKLIPKMILTNY